MNARASSTEWGRFDLAVQLDAVIGSREIRGRLADNGWRYSRAYTWAATAAGHAKELQASAERGS